MEIPDCSYDEAQGAKWDLRYDELDLVITEYEVQSASGVYATLREM